MNDTKAVGLVAGILAACALVGGIAATIIDTIIHRHAR